ncbi:MAG: hypothetical protein NTY66_01670 [Candidatus Vogelbacteria bacterium]|nr:hypothetical protein [Candidatus Vogelbacteria bacterium]
MEQTPKSVEQASAFLEAVDEMIAKHDDPDTKQFLKTLATINQSFIANAGQPAPAELILETDEH